MIRDRELQEVAGNSFVAKDRARIFDGRANVEVTALGIVSGNEIEAAIVFIIDAGRVHKAAGAGGLERFGQLANFKPTEIRWQRDEVVVFQEADHFSFSTLVCFQKV